MPEVISAAVKGNLHVRLRAIREELVALESSAASEHFQVKTFECLLKSTISLCPECLAHVPALVFARDGRVLIRKYCERHGFSDAVLENDSEFYHLSNKDRWGRRYAGERVIAFPQFDSACESGGCGDYIDDALFADQTA